MSYTNPGGANVGRQKDPMLAGLLAAFLFPFGLLYVSVLAFGVGLATFVFVLMLFFIPFAGVFIGSGALFLCSVCSGVGAYALASKQAAQQVQQPLAAPTLMSMNPAQNQQLQDQQFQQVNPVQQPTQWVAAPPPPPAVDRGAAPVQLPPAPNPGSRKPYRPSY